MEAKLGRDPIDPVSGIEILHDHDLEASGAALARCNNRPGEEEFPNLNLLALNDGH